MNETYYPPPAFHFSVTVIGSLTIGTALTNIDACFMEVTGIEAEFGTEEVVEGGENRFIHRLPSQTKYSNLVLKRGAVTKDSILGEWVGLTIGSNLSLPILPQNLVVSLLNEKHSPLVAWSFFNAYPVRSKVSAMNSMENNILMESFELAYNYFQRVSLGSAVSIAANAGAAALAVAAGAL